jgi:hypothetical protein
MDGTSLADALAGRNPSEVVRDPVPEIAAH